MWIKEYFTIYVDLLILAIGAYMAFIGGPDLAKEDMVREGQFLKVAGYAYLIIGVLGILIGIGR
ncbi:MAG: CLC_0170 family protein [Cellulosilyticum sp.]|nr:CLC_0170 family protein [Cellulosilyticum sp.]